MFLLVQFTGSSELPEFSSLCFKLYNQEGYKQPSLVLHRVRELSLSGFDARTAPFALWGYGG